ncbi:patronin isoform X2 [Bacillus rossius redtenbacheri]|uniref:patronin isoform X2 n=1 Tax=Bacillus rossius redtenbacheri TaxID=93214 RepID=UPI002FDCE80C
MWCAISKLFSKTNCNQKPDSLADDCNMDRTESRSRIVGQEGDVDSYDTRQAKQRASVKWLLSKAYNNKVPDNLKEPFYRDHEDQEHLKPQIVHSLANAELYCLGLANIYSDPNYHNLNHWGIIQALVRKGVTVVEPSDAQLTETVLIQTNPIKLSAHMAVIDAMMVLYAKEVVTPDRVVAAIQRFNSGVPVPDRLPADHEDALLLWLNSACAALWRSVEQSEGDRKPPLFPAIQDLRKLSDGVGLATLISFYCPEELPWSDIAIDVGRASQAVQNLVTVSEFCSRCLPASVFHMMPEDVTYLHGCMKPNLTVFLADLFNVLEIHPVKCVRYPGTERASYLREAYPRNSQGVAHKRSFPQSISAIPDLRSSLDDHAGNFTVSKSAPSFQTSLPLKKSHSLQQADAVNRIGADSGDRDDRHNPPGEEQFVVHRGRGVPTLSSVAARGGDDSPSRPARDRQGVPVPEAKEGKGQSVAAGRPSNWEDQRRSSYAGRRSRRNSITDDSQLTLENFGGSQENLHFLGRNPDKEPAVHVAQRLPQENNVPVRTSAQETRGSGVELIFNDNGYSREKQDADRPEQQPASVSLKDMLSRPREEPGDAASLLELSRVRSAGDLSSKGIQQALYMQQDLEPEDGSPAKNSSILNRKGITANGTGEKKTSFAALPNNTTTWQQQSSGLLHQAEVTSGDDGDASGQVMASQLHNIRMKLEEKRRRIESEKRRMEVVMSKQRQKVGKAAFLQAVTKGKGSFAKSPELDSSKDSNGDVPDSVAKPQRPFSLQEINENVSTVEHKWLDSGVPFIEERKTPDIENMNLEQYQQSLAQMNSSLHEIQSDIQRLASQQHQIQDINYYSHQQHQQLQQQQQQQQQQHMLQQLAAQQQQMHNFAFQHQQQQQGLPHMDSPQQFYLHEQQSHRRTWSQQPPPPPLDLYQPHESRPMWGDAPRHHTMSPKPQFSSYNCQPQGGFILRDGKPADSSYLEGGGADARYHNGDHRSLGASHGGYAVAPQPQHASFQPRAELSPRPLATPPPASPQHRPQGPGRLAAAAPGPGDGPVPVPTPSVDDMEPQSISFIGMPDDPSNTISQGLKGLHISSGSRTYRIPSPTRPAISRNSFQQQDLPEAPSYADQLSDEAAEKGFYISFDNDNPPKRPKPPLRVKRSSPKKERALSQYDVSGTFEREEFVPQHPARLEPPPPREAARTKEPPKKPDGEGAPGGVGLVIGPELLNPDPNALDEMERKKERIMLLSLQRRQQQEEQKQLKEHEAQRRREMEKLKQEERERKKEEERLRRNAILEQYKLKKAMEEAEREGKLLPDKSDHLGAKPVPKMRSKTSAGRPRPKTIHVDSGGVDMTDDILSPSRSKKGSTSNLTDRDFSSPLRRDFYRGSQDSLADRMDERRGLGASLFRGSPDDGRGASPCRSVNQLGRRGSYKTSRGSSTDQDSLAYRHTDTDSGLGRATPPRRAPSPGMGSMRHLPSPSGPGSLPPGLMTKRRAFDDGSSDISSTPSSMLEYTGPRLYKQPATKSNRGIMLNAVEYCVFPGVVNKEAKQRVREEIARSESKHFLILFRDTGFQFRALYSYCPEREDITKLFGTGPKQVNDRMFDKFFKYNSGGKCFSQVHTKHLTVTIDAFTIHNSLWQGKKVSLPNKKDMALVI